MLLTVSEVAAKFGVHKATVGRWCRIGAIRHITLPSRGNCKRYRINEYEVETYLRGKCY